MLNSIDADGTKTATTMSSTCPVSEAVDVPVVAREASATCSTWSTAFSVGKVDAVLAASIFHFGEYSIAEAKAYMKSHGIPVRM